MSLDLLTLAYKRVRTVGGEDLLDLSEASFDINKSTRIEHIHKVDSATAGRPWLVSHLYYGSSSYCDLLCFFNGISNPFSLEEGQILLIPNLQDAIANTNDNNKIPSKDVDSSDKLPLVDKRRLSRKNQSAVEPTLAPNETTEDSIEVVGGKIKLGNNVTDADCLDGTESVAQVRSKIIRNRLKSELRNG